MALCGVAQELPWQLATDILSKDGSAAALLSLTSTRKCPYHVVLCMQVTLFFSALHAKCPYHVVLYCIYQVSVCMAYNGTMAFLPRISRRPASIQASFLPGPGVRLQSHS